MRRLGLGGALVVAMLATGCGGADDSGQSQPGSPGAGTGGPVACTEIGCDSGLFLNVRPIAAQMPNGSKVRVCLESRCKTFSAREPLAMIVDRKLSSKQNVTVTITAISTQRGRVVRLRESKTVRTVRAQPNGPHCPPVCFQVPLKLDPKTAHLIRTSS